MKKKKTILSKKTNNNTTSKEYTIEELIYLGKKQNTIEIAPPLFPKKNLKIK